MGFQVGILGEKGEGYTILVQLSCVLSLWRVQDEPINVVANGYGDYEGTHASVYIYLMQGENDTI